MSERASFPDRPLVQLTTVRFKEFWREPEAVFWSFVFPILLAAGLGIAFRNRPAEVLKVGAVALRPPLTNALGREKGLAIEGFDSVSGDQALRAGNIVLLATGMPDGSVKYRYDDTNPQARGARLTVDGAVQRAAGMKNAVGTSDDLVHEPGSRYIDFLIPGLLGLNLMGSGIWALGFSIVDARRKNLLKRLVASPMSRAQYLLSFLLSRLSLLLIEVIALVGFGAVAFGVPVRGSLWDLAGLCLVSSLCFSALGLLIASRARTIEGASGLMNLVMLPMWIFSGVFFSSERYPDVLQPVIRALPLTAVIEALRANMLQGIPLAHLSFQLAIITGWLVICFFIALKIFRWR
ncbi:MAG: ABC transporter permease [Acidobacteriota bacterium]|nr:ABC transporter permease [Acidobacteriota bacterium]